MSDYYGRLHAIDESRAAITIRLPDEFRFERVYARGGGGYRYHARIIRDGEEVCAAILPSLAAVEGWISEQKTGPATEHARSGERPQAAPHPSRGFDGGASTTTQKATLTSICCGGYRARIFQDDKVVAMEDFPSAHEAALWIHEQRISRGESA